MAVIRPFFSIRPSEEKADKIAALPYDVYNREEAKAAVANHPLSFLNIDRAETQFDDTVDTYDERVYQKAHDLLWDMVEKGDFIREKKRCYYIYELTMDGRTQTGITACASIDDYANGVIKKHENTRADKEEDRIRHVDTCSMQTGPIFLAYRAKEDLKEKIGELKKQAFWLVFYVAIYAAVYFFAIDRVYGLLQMGVVLALPVIRLYNGRRGRSQSVNRVMKWLFYVYYPLHLFVIGLIIR